MIGLNGGLLGVRRAPGVGGLWLPNEHVNARREGTWPTGADTLFSSVALLLRFDGATGTPSLSNLGNQSGVTFSTSGSPTISSDQLLFGGNAIRFGPGNTYVTATVTGGLGAGDLCLEFWAYPLTTPSPGAVFNSRTSGTSGDGMDTFSDWRAGTNAVFLVSTGVSIASSRWYHVAYVRRSGTWYRYLDGAETIGTESAADFTSGTTFRIGGSPEGNVSYFNGYMGEFRLTRGAARYTGPFTPPNQRFAAY